jgi:hypothetical protein
MKLRDADGWKIANDANADPYGHRVMTYAEDWANATNFNLVYGGRTYSVQADVAVTWTKYHTQTLMSPEEPVVLDESALHELIEVLDDTGDEHTPTVGLAEAISRACTDVTVVGPGLVYDER